MKFVVWLKRQAEICTSIGVVGGGAVAVILFFGGSFPPWQTVAQAETAQSKSDKIQADTVSALGKINNKLDTFEQRLDHHDCSDLSKTFGQANAALAKSPNDPIAQALRETAQAQMRAIAGCTPY